MRIHNMIKTAPVAVWFEPASTDRVSWDGLGAEIRDKTNSGDENVEYSFAFQGPEKEKQDFLAKVAEYHLGSAATQENMAESAQNYKESAQNASRLGNETLAFNLWRTATETLEDPEAQLEVARRYHDGNGVEKNEEATKWYRKAGQNGCLEAQLEMIKRCGKGIGMEPSRTEAVVWCREAADQGDAFAQNELGKSFLYGNGVATDKAEAFQWFWKAANQGDEEAKNAVKRLESGSGSGVGSAAAAAVALADQLTLADHMV